MWTDLGVPPTGQELPEQPLNSNMFANPGLNTNVFGGV